MTKQEAGNFKEGEGASPPPPLPPPTTYPPPRHPEFKPIMEVGSVFHRPVKVLRRLRFPRLVESQL